MLVRTVLEVAKSEEYAREWGEMCNAVVDGDRCWECDTYAIHTRRMFVFLN